MMKRFSAGGVRMLFLTEVPPSPERNLANATYEICNGCLAHETFVVGSDDLHGREDVKIDDMIALSIFDGELSSARQFDPGPEGEAGYQEMLRLFQALDEEGDFDDNLLLRCMEDDEAFVVVACARLKAADGTSTLVIYRNKGLARDQARQFLKQQATSFLAAQRAETGRTRGAN